MRQDFTTLGSYPNCNCFIDHLDYNINSERILFKFQSYPAGLGLVCTVINWSMQCVAE